MKKNTKQESKTKIYNLKYYFAIAGLIIFGFILLTISDMLSEGFLKSAVSNVASGVLFSGIFSFINEKITKDSLIELILDKMNLKQDIERTGIEEVHTDIAKIDYSYYIKNSKKNIDIVHIYGRTWTNTCMDEIKERLANSNCKIRVVLVSPDSKYISGLASSFDMSEEDLIKTLNDVKKMWFEIHKYWKQSLNTKRPSQSDLKVYYHRGQPSSSIYRVDDRLINVQNKFSGNKTRKLAALICKDSKNPDDLYKTFLTDIENLISTATLENFEVV